MRAITDAGCSTRPSRNARAGGPPGRSDRVSVNISATNLLDAGFTGLVRDLLERHDFPPSALVLEITETSIITDFDRSGRVIEELRDLGVVVSIDDFGAGFTSLAYLSSLAVGELKLDRTFITDLTSPASATRPEAGARHDRARPRARTARRRRRHRGRGDAGPADAISAATSPRATSSACQSPPINSLSVPYRQNARARSRRRARTEGHRGSPR